MAVIRVYPDPIIQNILIEASTIFETSILQKMRIYHEIMNEAEENTNGDPKNPRLIETERKIEQEMFTTNEGDAT